MQSVRSRLSQFVYKFSRGMSPYSVAKTINPDIAKERKSAQFKVEDFAVWWYGGAKKLQEKREMARLILEDPELQDEYPSTYLSYQDMYDNSIRKIYLLAKKLRKLQAERNPGGTDIFPAYMQGRLSRMIHDQGSPIDLHLYVFVPAIKGHGTPEQVAKWLPLAMNFEILGTYVQTELGHGTYLRGLETRADYDPKTEEFVLSSPNLSSYKWWPGGLGHTVNYSVVMAQLYIENKSHGVQMFMVQLRDEETHMPLPGITIGDIGNKMGMQTVNNGFLAFKDFRIPRMNMLMKNSQVLPDGTFKKSPVSVLAYLTMVEVRVSLVRQSADLLSWACTIATRYAAVRRQSVINPSEPEHQIMDHVTQQMKLFPPIAKAIMLKLNSDFVCEMFDAVSGELKQQKYDRLPEMHALSCCLKAISTEEARQSVEVLRMSCGGHGYMLASALPMVYGTAAPAPTYEGENTVLLLQTARFLMKSWAIAASGGPLTPTVAYLGDAVKTMNAFKWDASLNGMVKALQFVAANKTRVAFNELEAKKKQMTKEEASNVTAIELVQAAEAHGVCFLAATPVEQIIERPSHNSAQLSTVLRDLLELYLVNACLQNMGSILRFISLTETDLKDLQQRLGAVLARIRPNAVAIVDGFDYHDKELRSALGCYDGNVYEKMYEMAQQNPMNKIPVQKSFQQYLKPFMKANL